jgi:gamma-glutamyl-gamma-aminobutyrate hydrolase PuuD
MTKPLIGITVDCKYNPEDPRTRGELQLHWNYADAVGTCGGVPILIPPMADMEAVAKIIHGWLIPGGDDIDAKEFGEETHPKAELQDPARFAGESALMRSVSRDLPILGICYGCQFLNVVQGGTLIQHLPDVVGHGTHSGGTMQGYELDATSKLANIVDADTMEGKSYHHQAVAKVAQGLKVVGKSEDGTIEALESTERPWMIGVQWHPERTIEDPATRRLFEAFISAAREYANRIPALK